MCALSGVPSLLGVSLIRTLLVYSAASLCAGAGFVAGYSTWCSIPRLVARDSSAALGIKLPLLSASYIGRRSPTSIFIWVWIVSPCPPG
eukprot:scaffold193892_cov40-Tisochrysis_lutea.AAC.1